MFSKTPQLVRAVELINDIEDDKIPLLLSRIIKSLPLGTGPFNTEELDQLTDVLDVAHDELDQIIDTATFIYQETAYKGTSGTKLKVHLEELGMEEECAVVFGKTWIAHGPAYIDHLKSRPMMATHLRQVDWRLNLHMGHRLQSKVLVPNALISLKIKEDEAPLSIEFTHEELLKFYDNLETIQQQVDGMAQ